jgi:hypothetical protein
VFLLAASGCSFSPSSLPGDGADASIPVIDGAVIDAEGAVDADLSLADAGAPDATFDECTGKSSVLPLSTVFSLHPPASGDPMYAPSCAVVSGFDSFFSVDVVNPPVGADLVVDLIEETTGGRDAVLDFTSNCETSLLPTQCRDVSGVPMGGGTGRGEVIVLPQVTAGRHYVAVDTAGMSLPSAVQLRAFVRPVAEAEKVCDPLLVTSRCTETPLAFCLDEPTVADDAPLCNGAIVPVVDAEENETCATADPVSGDTGWVGTSTGNSDDDFIRLEAVADFRLRAVVYTANGGCASDFRLRFRAYDGSCANEDEDREVVADDQGLGPCPVLDIGVVDSDQLNVLSVERRDAPDKEEPPLGYFLTIDYLPPSP